MKGRHVCVASRCNKLWARRGGVNLQQEVEPHLTERPPRDFVGSVARGDTEMNIQPDRGRRDGFPGHEIFAAGPQVNAVVRPRR